LRASRTGAGWRIQVSPFEAAGANGVRAAGLAHEVASVAGRAC
jgi:hypothetical protein